MDRRVTTVNGVGARQEALRAALEYRQADPAEAASKSRWQHDAVPPWRRVEPKIVCEVRVTNRDLGRWARFPVAFVRWRPDRSQTTAHPISFPRSQTEEATLASCPSIHRDEAVGDATPR